IYLLVKPVNQENIQEQLEQSFENNNRVALESPDQPTFKEAEAVHIFDDLISMARSLHAHSEQLQALDDFSEVVTHPELTASAMLLPHIKNHSLMTFGVEVAKKWKAHRINNPKLLPAMANLSDAAQKLIFHAIRLGIRYYEVRDEHGEELLMLTYENVTQVVYSSKVSLKNPVDYLYELFPEIKKDAFEKWTL
ncbi:MAG: gamma-glutamylcysteine synthetase, partial [Lentilactobacillus diolivorans]